AGLLAAGQRPAQAGGVDRTGSADELGRLDLCPAGPDVAVRKECLRVAVPAGGPGPPVRAGAAGRPGGRGGHTHGVGLYPSAAQRMARMRNRALWSTRWLASRAIARSGSSMCRGAMLTCRTAMRLSSGPDTTVG